MVYKKNEFKKLRINITQKPLSTYVGPVNTVLCKNSLSFDNENFTCLLHNIFAWSVSLEAANGMCEQQTDVNNKAQRFKNHKFV